MDLKNGRAKCDCLFCKQSSLLEMKLIAHVDESPATLFLSSSVKTYGLPGLGHLFNYDREEYLFFAGILLIPPNQVTNQEELTTWGTLSKRGSSAQFRVILSYESEVLVIKRIMIQSMPVLVSSSLLASSSAQACFH